MGSNPLERLANGRTPLHDVAAQSFLAVAKEFAGLNMRLGLQSNEARDLLELAYAMSAAEEIEANGGDAHNSAIAIKAGIDRKRVGKVLASIELEGLASGAGKRWVNVLAVLLQRWHDDPKYSDRCGHPKALRKNGIGLSFEDLARDYGRDHTPASLLRELIEHGCVKEEGDYIRPLKRFFLPDDISPETVRTGAQAMTDMIRTVRHNVADCSETAEKRFQRWVWADVPKSQAADINRKLCQKYEDFLTITNEILELTGVDPESDEPSVRIGVGVYEVNDGDDTPF